MHNSKKTTGALLGAALAAALAATVPAHADSLVPGVTSCGASGSKQGTGALLGAVAGGLLGNSVSGHNRTTGTLVGAAVGAAAGSAVGCQMQHNDEKRTTAAEPGAYQPATYRHDGYELARGVAPARYLRLGDGVMATRTVALRAAPDAGSGRVGELRRGERIQALAQVRGTDWMLVGRDGVGVGYVRGAFVRSESPDYAAGY